MLYGQRVPLQLPLPPILNCQVPKIERHKEKLEEPLIPLSVPLFLYHSSIQGEACVAIYDEIFTVWMYISDMQTILKFYLYLLHLLRGIANCKEFWNIIPACNKVSRHIVGDEKKPLDFFFQ